MGSARARVPWPGVCRQEPARAAHRPCGRVRGQHCTRSALRQADQAGFHTVAASTLESLRHLSFRFRREGVLSVVEVLVVLMLSKYVEIVYFMILVNSFNSKY